MVGHEDRLRVRATAQAPADAATWSVRLKVAPSAALLAERGPAVARHYLGAAALSLQTDLGPWAGWPSDEVCVQAEQVDAQGRSAAGEVQCFPLERDPGMDEACGVDLESDCEDDPALDTEPAADGPGQEASLHQGCSATGAAPSAPLWLLLCLPLIRRRRR